jgi:hypothetical protein
MRQRWAAKEEEGRGEGGKESPGDSQRGWDRESCNGNYSDSVTLQSPVDRVNRLARIAIT